MHNFAKACRAWRVIAIGGGECVGMLALTATLCSFRAPALRIRTHVDRAAVRMEFGDSFCERSTQLRTPALLPPRRARRHRCHHARTVTLLLTLPHTHTATADMGHMYEGKYGPADGINELPDGIVEVALPTPLGINFEEIEYFQPRLGDLEWQMYEMPLFLILSLICGVLGALYVLLFQRIVAFRRKREVALLSRAGLLPSWLISKLTRDGTTAKRRKAEAATIVFSILVALTLALVTLALLLARRWVGGVGCGGAGFAAARRATRVCPAVTRLVLWREARQRLSDDRRVQVEHKGSGRCGRRLFEEFGEAVRATLAPG